jgi:hypothetical protein
MSPLNHHGGTPLWLTGVPQDPTTMPNGDEYSTGLPDFAPAALSPAMTISRGAIHIFLSVAWVSAGGKVDEESGISMGA